MDGGITLAAGGLLKPAAAQSQRTVVAGEHLMGDGDLVFLEMFKAWRYQDISLNDWLTHLPPELGQHLGLSSQTLAAIPNANFATLPRV